MWIVILVTFLVTGLIVIVGLNFATPEKKLEHTVQHRFGVADPQFRREMGVLLGPAIVDGNTVQDLQNGDQIFPAMLDAIASAKKTISFETYIYWDGAVGKRFADALSERAKAGVKVHVTIDWAGSYNMRLCAASRPVSSLPLSSSTSPGFQEARSSFVSVSRSTRRPFEAS